LKKQQDKEGKDFFYINFTTVERKREQKVLTVRCPGTILDTAFNHSLFSSLPEYQISADSSFDSLKGQNLGFPLRPYLRSCAPFFNAVMAFHTEQETDWGLTLEHNSHRNSCFCAYFQLPGEMCMKKDAQPSLLTIQI
jgi:hypothetical protein